MRLRQTSITIIFLLLVLGVSALAAPPVALLRVKAGDATLDGQSIHKAQMASEGQKLRLNKGAEVRVMLMGTSSEVLLSGPQTLTLSKDNLMAQAKRVSRGSVAVAEDIGNTNTVAAVTQRANIVPLNPSLPPRLVDGEYIVEFDGGETFQLLKDTDVRVTITALDGSQEPFDSNVITKRLKTLQITPGFVVPGRRYVFKLVYNNGTTKYQQTFRVLSEPEWEFLTLAGTKASERHVTEKNVEPLLDMASLCQSLDKNKLVLIYLKKAKTSPYLNDRVLEEKIDGLISSFKLTSEMKLPATKL